ncbi:MAG: glycosyltransferase [Opitutaceae bacterium]|nr:glycosyltransferase [Opitutaceae bacterium]
MEPPEFKVLHVSPRVQARGGIETLHAFHRAWPGRPEFVALFDRDPLPRSGYANLDFTWRTPLWRMRRSFARLLARHPGSLVIYHNGWGLPLLHDLDRAARRVVFLHADPAYHAADLPAFAGLVDGVIGVTPALREPVLRTLRGMTDERLTIVRAPVEVPAGCRARPRGAGLVLGYAGRLERAEKRLDQLPALVAALDRSGLDCRIELLGEGPLRPWLERRLGDRVRLHGWVPKDEFWRIMSGWDAMVMFSEHEGGPIALLEGMALGLIPFYPAQQGSWADVYVPQVDARCHYPPGDMPALARAIGQVMLQPAAQLAATRERAQVLVAGHRREEYESACRGCLRRVAELPRLSQDRRRRFRLTDGLPLGVVTRWVPAALH